MEFMTAQSAMLIMNEKTDSTEGIELTNQESIRIRREKENCTGIFDTIKQSQKSF